MIKNFVLDTNVLIHNPRSLHSFAEHNVIVPLVVIEELDKFKGRGRQNPKQSALCRYDAVSSSCRLLAQPCEVMGVRALNVAQKFAFDALLNPDVHLVTLVGQAGTGKTLISLACALAQIMPERGDGAQYEKLLVARPIVPMGKDIGYLPGEKDQKLKYWMQPIYDNLDYILHISDHPEIRRYSDAFSATEYLMRANIIEIEALTYIRGRSIPYQFLIVDEAQNLTPHEVKTIISRAGQGTKIVLTGDPDQIDNPYLDANSNGLTYTVERLKGSPLVAHILLDQSERSELAALAVERL